MSSYGRIQSNITPLNAKIAHQIEASASQRDRAAAHYRKAHARRKKRIMWIGLLVTMIFLAQLLIGQVNLHAANKSLTTSEQKLESAKSTNKDLKKNVSQLNDPSYLQQILREKYGYTRQGEIIYNLPDYSSDK